MQNVKLKVEGTILTIEVDLSKVVGPSKTGKTVIIATTSGNQSVPSHPGVSVGLNVYTKR